MNATNYTRDVGFGEAFKLFFSNYINFAGRSNRGEYWKAFLMVFGLSILLFLIDMVTGVPVLNPVFSLIAFVPGIAIGVRRLHDIGKSGWWYLLILVPLVGVLVLIYFFIQPPMNQPNNYG